MIANSPLPNHSWLPPAFTCRAFSCSWAYCAAEFMFDTRLAFFYGQLTPVAALQVLQPRFQCVLILRNIKLVVVALPFLDDVQQSWFVESVAVVHYGCLFWGRSSDCRRISCLVVFTENEQPSRWFGLETGSKAVTPLIYTPKLKLHGGRLDSNAFYTSVVCGLFWCKSNSYSYARPRVTGASQCTSRSWSY